MRFETSVEVEAAPEAGGGPWSTWSPGPRSPRRCGASSGHGQVASAASPGSATGLPASTWAVTGGPGIVHLESTAPGVRTVATHELAAAGPGRTTLLLGLAQSGPLAPLLGAVVGARARRFVSMEAAGLKKSEAAGPVA